MALRTRSSILLAALIAAGAGCDASVDPIVFSPKGGCPNLQVPNTSNPWTYADEPLDRMISDFESGTGALVRVAGRDGEWVLGTDLTSRDILAMPQEACAARGTWAGHFRGSGFTSWGANWSAIFHPAIFNPTTGVNQAVAYDGSAYGGISFWAACGDSIPSDAEMSVGLSTMDTAWNGSICFPASKCADHYLVKITLTHSWQRFNLRLDQMKQSGLGFPQVSMRRDQMVGIVFWTWQDFDVWIDDVRFEP